MTMWNSRSGRLLAAAVSFMVLAGCTATTAEPPKDVSVSPVPPVKVGGGGSKLVAPSTTTTTDAPSSTTIAPEVSVPSGSMPGVAVDASAIPAARGGVSVQRVVPATYPKTAGDGSAAFRVNCGFSHMAFDDPIVFPGRSGASHLHIFFGNTGVDASSTPESVRSTGASTCTGGTANRSSYWAPAVIDTRTGAPVLSDANPVDREHFLQVYYKSGYDGVAPATVQNFPVGLRMIAGSATSTGPQDGVVRYHCDDGAISSGFPQCRPGEILTMSIEFPQCWDGVNLDSPNHKSHMAYGAGWPDRGCPSSHPVPLAQITQNFRYRVPASGMSTWRLSSDMYEGRAGYSAHADWMNGWDPAVFQRVVDNCYRGGYDCRMNLLGDGYVLG